MNTKRILTNQAKPGMIVVDDIYTADNHLVIQRNTSLTKEIIQRIRYYSIFSIKVYIEGEEESEPQEKFAKSPPENTYFDRVQASEEYHIFAESFSGSVDHLKDSLNDIVINTSDVQTDELLAEVDHVISQSRNPLHMLDMMHCMRGYDDSTYVHSMNVSMIANIIGKWLGYPEGELRILTVAGLLHDIGKLKIPKEIIKKPGKLTDEEFHIVQSHPQYGYEILQSKNLDERVKLAALQHHERTDGTGYPNKLHAKEIDEISKIISIADVYDAMTANRVYREGLCPFTVIEFFEHERHLYDPGILYMFLQRTVEAYINTDVLLSNGEKGKVVLLNQNILSKPIVITPKKNYDLSKETDLSIQTIL